jgi:quercetin 2,3-dioxygenase
MLERRLMRVHTPVPQQGFMGPHHIARPVIDVPFEQSDPFIMLMDDYLDKKDKQPVGGPHPHAGFETVTLLLNGELGEPPYDMKAGDFQMMTAGSGIVHTETITSKTKLRLLQLWLTLPKSKRWTTPRLQDLRSEHVPTMSSNDMQVKLYSGSLAGLVSPVENYVPVIIADIQINPGTEARLDLPAHYNTFLYVLKGPVKVGEEEKEVFANQVGWLDRFDMKDDSEIKLAASENGATLILYAGEPQGSGIVSHGPFIGDTSDDITRLCQDYRRGKMKHILEVPEKQRITW